MGWRPQWGPLVDPVAKKRAYQKVKTQLKELLLTGDYNIEWSKTPDTFWIARISHRTYRERLCTIVLGNNEEPLIHLEYPWIAEVGSIRDITPQDPESFASTIADWLDKSRPLDLE